MYTKINTIRERMAELQATRGDLAALYAERDKAIEDELKVLRRQLRCELDELPAFSGYSEGPPAGGH